MRVKIIGMSYEIADSFERMYNKELVYVNMASHTLDILKVDSLGEFRSPAQDLKGIYIRVNNSFEIDLYNNQFTNILIEMED